MRIWIDEDKCIGCGNCQEICPAVFALDEEIGKSRVIDPDACDYADCCEAAEENCPVEAITIEPD
jgi:ferredoxin